MGQKKILIISPFENEFTGRGGRNVDLARKLQSDGHLVTLLTSNFDHGKKSKISTSDTKGIYLFVNVFGYKKNLSLSRFFTHIQFSLKSFFILRGKRFDVVFCSTIPPEITVLSKKIKAKRLVYDVRDVWPEALLSYKNVPLSVSYLFKKYCSFFYRYAFNGKCEFTVVAPSFLKWVKQYKKKGVFWKFIPLGFREETWASSDNEPFIYDYYYAGGITPQFSLCEFEGVLSGNMIFLGDGDEFLKVKKCFPDAFMPGVVSRLKADSIMKRSNCLILPSNKNARLPNKAFDYFASNKNILLGDNVSREVRYLFEVIYPKRKNVTDFKKFHILSRSYTINKLSTYLTKELR